MRQFPDHFEVAFSFAGAQRAKVRSVAEAVECQVGHGKVFFDEWFEQVIAGFDADLRLQDIYAQRTTLVVVCVSQAYNDKPWTRIEHREIRALTMDSEREILAVLPLRFGDGDVEGVHANAIVPDVRDREPSAIGELIQGRLVELKRRCEQLSNTPKTPSQLPDSTPNELRGPTVFRWRHAGANDHFYTTDPLGEVAQDAGYAFAGPAFQLAVPGASETTKLYRWYSPSRRDHFYTTHPEGEQAQMLGYVPEGFVGYVFARQLYKTVPLLRWWHPTICDHLYSTHEEEADRLVSGYFCEGVIGFVFPNAAN